MYKKTYSVVLGVLFPSALAASLLVAGCSKNEAPSETPMASDSSKGGPSGPGGMKGPGGPGGPGGGRFAPVSATATSAEIFQQKCSGCHGDKGQGGRGPNLTKLASDPDSEIYNTIHNGKGKMPPFAKQMTETQINQLVSYVKSASMAK